MATADIATIVDLDRYPLDRPESEEVRCLLAVAQKALDLHALFSMPGFVREDVVAVMAQELEERIPGASRFECVLPAYPSREGDDWPQDHVRKRLHSFAYHQVLNHQIPNNSLLRTLYFWEPLKDFLRQAMRYQSFYRSECPHLALTAKIAGPNDTDGWHFDSNDVTFSILLQRPEAGGQFEYVPQIRAEDNQNYAAVDAAFRGTNSDIVRPAMAPGDLNVFKGNQSVHRVTPVEGDRRRIIGLFCYDQQPGTSFDQSLIEGLTGQAEI